MRQANATDVDVAQTNAIEAGNGVDKTESVFYMYAL